MIVPGSGAGLGTSLFTLSSVSLPFLRRLAHKGSLGERVGRHHHRLGVEQPPFSSLALMGVTVTPAGMASVRTQWDDILRTSKTQATSHCPSKGVSLVE